MRGLLIFVAGALCGAALLAWLWLPSGEPPVAQAPAPVPAQPEPPAGGVSVTQAEIEARAPSGQGTHGAGARESQADANAFPEAATTPGGVATPAPTSSAEAPPAPDAAAATAAARPPADIPPPALVVPVQGITPAMLHDTFNDARGEGRRHDAIDILAPTGRPVLAVADGRIAKLFDSVPGGLTVYQFDGSERLAYYYAHLDRYADGLQEGATVRQGELIGYVGHSGNASEDAPHLHFAVFVLGPEKQWWKGNAVNPFPLLRAGTAAEVAP